ncbi:MAG: DUF3467 domain-containing protein [Hyphomicrobiaceae bacterium]
MTDHRKPREEAPPLATYANFCEVGHNAYEFLIDFGQFQPETSAVLVHSRIVSGPVQAKLFARLLIDAVSRYEAEHGTIADIGEDDALAALLNAMPDFERRAAAARRRRIPSDDPDQPPAER